MYAWYQKAVRCYAFLDDCVLPSHDKWKPTLDESADIHNALRGWRSGLPIFSIELARGSCVCMSVDQRHHSDDCSRMFDFLGGSRWFTRGWTLQELIAPRQLLIFDHKWRFIASRDDILLTLEAITGVHKEAFWPGGDAQPRISLSSFSVAQRMSWASRRSTTREEDEAYCLMGVFGINMPLLYGEGRKAFIRLQQEIMKTTADQSILAWESLGPFVHIGNALLANSPACFTGDARNIVWDRKIARSEVRLTHQGLEAELSLHSPTIHLNERFRVAVLDCVFNEPGGHSHAVGLLLHAAKGFKEMETASRALTPTKVAFSDPVYRYTRGRPDRRLIRLPRVYTERPEGRERLLILWEQHELRSIPSGPEIKIKMEFLRAHKDDQFNQWHVIAVYPRYQWFTIKWDLKLPRKHESFAAIALFSNRCGVVFIVLGLTLRLNQHIYNSTKNDVMITYWVLGDDTANWIETDPARQSMSEANHIPRMWRWQGQSHVRCGLARVQHHLEELCRRASSFAAKDYFEHTKRRAMSHKTASLPSGEMLSATLEKAIWSCSNENLALHLHVAPEPQLDTATATEDFFRLHEIDHAFERAQMSI